MGSQAWDHEEKRSSTVSATFLASFLTSFRSHSRTVALCGSTMINFPASYCWAG